MIVFDKFYEDYDDWYTTTVGGFIDGLQTQTAFGLLKPKKDDNILDVGCGTGNFSLKLYDKGSIVTGIDISKNMLGLARKKIKDGHSHRLNFLEMDSYKLDFPDDHFDKVISMAAFEFIYKPKEAFDEIMRVLKPNGILVIGTIQKNSKWYDLYRSPLFKGSAYEKADFKDRTTIENLNKQCHVSSKECLFIPPSLPECEYTQANEDGFKSILDIGGFVCVSFQKKI